MPNHNPYLESRNSRAMSGMIDLINSFMREEARREKKEDKEWAAELEALRVLEQEEEVEQEELTPAEAEKKEAKRKEDMRASRNEQLWAAAWAAAEQKPKEKKKRKGKKGSD